MRILTDQFLVGYVCALCSIIRYDGCVTTQVKEVWREGGYTLKECIENGVNSIDIDIIKQHKEELGA